MAPRSSAKNDSKEYEAVVAAICACQFLEPSEIKPEQHFVADLECDVHDMIEIQMGVEQKLRNPDLFDDLEDGAMALMTVGQFAHWVELERRRPKRREEEKDVAADSD